MRPNLIRLYHPYIVLNDSGHAQKPHQRSNQASYVIIIPTWTFRIKGFTENTHSVQYQRYDRQTDRRNHFTIAVPYIGAGIAQCYSAGLRAGWSGVRVPVGAGNFSLHHRVQTGSGAHLASYPMGTRGSFLGFKVAGVWSWPFASICAAVKNAWSHTSTPRIRLQDVVLS
jgi:hypothetical protein